MSGLSLGSAVRGFFEDYLQCQRGLRMNTVRSYRDSFRLFLIFVAKDIPRPVSRLTLTDLTSERVRRFLKSLEEDRGNHIRSRNQRLSALRVFFEYIARQNPELLCEAERVTTIPISERPRLRRSIYSVRKSRPCLTTCPVQADSPYVIAVCYCFFTTPGQGYRRRQSCKPATSNSNRQHVCTFMAKATSGAYAHCGRKQPRC